jgi:hypothetical protein
MPKMDKSSNPWERDSTYHFDRELLKENHGPDAMIHLGLGSVDSDEDPVGALSIACEHEPEFETWLRENKREAELVRAESVGLRYRGHREPCGEETGFIFISKPIDHFAA